MPETESEMPQNSEQNNDKLSEIAEFYQDKKESSSSQNTAEPAVELSPFECYLEAFRKYATFSGRARRKELWYFHLFDALAYIVLAMFTGSIAGGEGLIGLYFLVSIIPRLSVAVRRLHDTGKSGWILLIGVIPLLGALFLLIFLVEDSKPGENKYGPNPKGIQE